MTYLNTNLNEILDKKMNFLLEIDKVKSILRESLILEGTRRENDAEHSWHMALTAMTLKEYFEEKVNMEKVLKMILLHDIVEIYAGDNPCFGPLNENKHVEELESAKRIFSYLSDDLKNEYMDLWLEFENQNTKESKFANCCDRIQGFYQNLTADGHTWKKFNVKESQVLKRVEPIKKYMPILYRDFVLPNINLYKARNIIKDDN